MDNVKWIMDNWFRGCNVDFIELGLFGMEIFKCHFCRLKIRDLPV